MHIFVQQIVMRALWSVYLPNQLQIVVINFVNCYNEAVADTLCLAAVFF